MYSLLLGVPNGLVRSTQRLLAYAKVATEVNENKRTKTMAGYGNLCPLPPLKRDFEKSTIKCEGSVCSCGPAVLTPTASRRCTGAADCTEPRDKRKLIQGDEEKDSKCLLALKTTAEENDGYVYSTC